jgi:Tat protein translocase TatB subunit
MLGIGPTELVVVAVLFLVIFGPSKMPQMARDIGKFVGQARGAIDEFKDELTSEDTDTKTPTRSREEGSQRRKNARAESNGHHQEDEDSEDLEDEPSESTSRERAEYDL